MKIVVYNGKKYTLQPQPLELGCKNCVIERERDCPMTNGDYICEGITAVKDQVFIIIKIEEVAE